MAVLTALLASHAAGAQKLIPHIATHGGGDYHSETAVIICPGGSYYWLSRKWEGSEVASKLNDAGFDAYVLEYRHAGTRYFLFGPLTPVRSHHYPEALEDVRAAVASLQAEGYRKIALAGFSAGGHLVLLAGETFAKEMAAGTGRIPDASGPDGSSGRDAAGTGAAAPEISCIAAVYPVVTFTEDAIMHKRSRNAFLGAHRRNAALRNSLSLEKHVPSNMPPVLLVNCVDDPVVDYRNSVRMDEALSAAGVPHKYLQYPAGGHGFGASQEKNPHESVHWIDSFIEMLSGQ